MKKPFAFIMAAVMLLALFTACAKKDKDAAEESGTGVQQTQSAKPAPGAETSPDVSVTTKAADLTTATVHPSDTETLNIAAYQEPGGMSQPGHAFGANMNVTTLFFENLLAWDSNTNDVAPWLATSWEWIDDLTLRLKLRDDVTSINGDPFTASDVVYTWNWNHSVTSSAAYYNMFDYEKTKAIDDYTVELALVSPYPYLIVDLAHTAYNIAVEASVEAAGGVEATQYNPGCGTGPYRLVEWQQGQVVKMERRDDYWGVTPYYKYIDYWTVTDATTRVFGVESGDYDAAMSPTISQTLSAKDNDKLTGWFTAAAGRNCNFYFNSLHEPLNVLEVRQAIALCIDYAAVLQVAASGQGVLTDSVYCSSFSSFYSAGDPADPDNYVKYDLEAAKQKMADAGYADGFTMNCKYRSTDDMTVKNAEVLQSMLREIKITLELVPQDSAAWYADMRAGEFDSGLSVGGNPNPKRNINIIDGRLTCAQTTGNCGPNWAPDEADEVIDRCYNTVDSDLLLAAHAELQDICRKYVPQVILYCPYAVNLTSSKIVNIALDSMGGPLWTSLYPAEYTEG